jgi:hypothetical protein
MNREIIPVSGFTLRSVNRDSANGVVLLHYDAPGVAGRFQITTPDYTPVQPYSITIRNATDARSPIDGGPIPPGTYRIADLNAPNAIHDLGSFNAPVVSPPAPTFAPFRENEIQTDITIPAYGNLTYFLGSRKENLTVTLPTFLPAFGSGITLTIMNWASTEGFAPNEARPFRVAFGSNTTLELKPNEKRSFMSIFTAKTGRLRWAPL